MLRSRVAPVNNATLHVAWIVSQIAKRLRARFEIDVPYCAEAFASGGFLT